jgi:hypothetical protein
MLVLIESSVFNCSSLHYSSGGSKCFKKSDCAKITIE